MADQTVLETERFHSALNYGLERLGRSNLLVKEKQYEILKAVVLENKDVMAVLPTGYGKSLVYQLLPSVFDYMCFERRPQIMHSTVFVISPLNAIMRDQIHKLKETGISVCVLKADHVDLDNEDVSFPLDLLKTTHYELIFAHPEVLVDSKKVAKLLKSTAFNQKVCAIVVDEAHLTTDWKEFRPAYGKLGSLASVFPSIPIIGLTATATNFTKKKIAESLGFIDPIIIEVNPDRPNIFLSSSTRPSHGEEKVSSVLEPLLSELQCKRLACPLTVVYGKLETISTCYAYFSDKMRNDQYEPIGASPIARNRLFTQFHAQYPEEERQRIVEELVTGNSKLRVVFATVAFGIGLDITNIRGIVHIGVPYTIEEYFQEAGRAGRDGLPAKAHIYFNSYDISKGKKNLSNAMREYVKVQNCKRAFILNYFGFQLPPRTGPLHECCDYHFQCCDCDDCVISCIPAVFEQHDQEDDLPTAGRPDAVQLSNQLEPEMSAKLLEELNTFRLSLSGTGRTFVGSTSLSSGISIQLIQQIVESATTYTSVECLEEKLPVFSRENAKTIWNILKKYI